MPLFIGASFVICHFFANYIPRVDLQIEEVFDDEDLDEDLETESENDSDEFGDSDGEVVAVVEFSEESV
jgi:3-oxoacyl-ACP reductase-like protein